MHEHTALLTPEEAARRLGCGRTFVYGLIRTGALPSVKLGRLRRVPVTAVDAYIAGLMDSTPKDAA